MTIVQRYDQRTTLDSSGFEATPQGGLRARARFTRTGVLDYERADGTRQREYRPPEEVFSPESIATLIDAPITHLHPTSGEVTAETFERLAKGHVSTGVEPEDEKYLAGKVVLQALDVVAGAKSGDLCEFSAGYKARLEMTPGVSPEGEAYDCIQRDIRYNHVAILPRGEGRAGPEVSLRLDSNGHQLTPEENEMELTAEDIAALKALAAAAPKLLEKKTEGEAKTDTDPSKLDTEEEKTDEDNATPAAASTALALSEEDIAALKALAAAAPKLLEELKEEPAATPEEQELIITDSIELREKAREVLGKDYQFRGKANRQIREDVIRHVDSKLSLKGRSDDAVAALFDASLARHAERADSKKELSNLRQFTRHDAADGEPDGLDKKLREHNDKAFSGK